MFVDRVTFTARGGRGGNGCVAFRREKFIPRGGPSGGNGGNGGSVFLEATPNLLTLIDFTYKPLYEAEAGKAGQGAGCHGANGKDRIVTVPLGTLVSNSKNELLADLTKPGQRVLLAKGGLGGRGNSVFTSSVQQAPRIAEKGTKGEEEVFTLELRLLADIGVIGKPNVGKSTLLEALSAAKPKVADYPFTTLSPVLGVVRCPNGSDAILAEVPGLIEGAHSGAGLGHDFLRHILRTRVLAYLLDASGDPMTELKLLQGEVELYEPNLAKRPSLAVLNKADLVASEISQMIAGQIRESGEQVVVVSAREKSNLDALMLTLQETLAHAPEIESPISKQRTIYRLKATAPKHFVVAKVKEGVYRVQGEYVQMLIERTSMDNDSAVERLQKQLDKLGVEKELIKHGIRIGDTVQIGDVEFNFLSNEADEET
jgi:GTP-binding protein